MAWTKALAADDLSAGTRQVVKLSDAIAFVAQ